MTNPIKTKIDELFSNTDQDGRLTIEIRPYPTSERKEPYVLNCIMDWDAEKCARITAETLRLYLALDDVQDFYDGSTIPFGSCEALDFDPDMDDLNDEEWAESFRIWTELLKSHGITDVKKLYSYTSELFPEEGEEVDFFTTAAWLIGESFVSNVGAGLSVPFACLTDDLYIIYVLSEACVKISCANGDKKLAPKK